MIWEAFFPWNPRKTKYSGSGSKVLEGNYLLEKCSIKGIKGDHVFNCVDKNAFILIDQCLFDSCTATSTQGILYFQLTDSGSCVLHSSNIVNSKLTSTDAYYMLCTIITSTSNSGMTKIDKSSFVSCGSSSFRISHMVFVENGYQECHEMNISKCNTFYRTVDHDHTSNGITSWGNFEGNSVGRILLYFNYKGIVKKSNFVQNDQKTADGSYGLVVTRDEGSILIAEGCYFADNDCLSICYIESATVHFIQCCILDKITNTKNAVIHNSFTFGKLTLETCVPVVTKCSKKNAIVGVFFGIIMTSQFIKDKS